MSQIDRIIQDLGARPSTKGNYIAKCPAHDDKRKSFTFSERDGKLFLRCWSGCSFEQILDKLILSGTVEPMTKGESYSPEVWINFHDPRVGKFGAFFDNPNYTVDRLYPYRDEAGNLVGFKGRFSPKTFRPFTHIGFDENKARGFGNIPYRLPEILDAVKAGRPVHQFEGEKDADNAANLGMVSTTFGGAKDLLPQEYLAKFANSCWVVWADNDAHLANNSGIKRAQEICVALHNHGCKVKLVVPPKGKDFSDWLDTGATIDDIKDLLASTPQWLPPAEQMKAAELPIKYDPNTEAFAAEFFANIVHNKIRFLCDIKSWFTFDGKSWTIDIGGDARESMKGMHEHLKRAMERLQPGVREELVKLITRVQTDAGVSAVLNLAKSVPVLRLHSVQLDARETMYKFACDNGVIDFKTEQLNDHNPDTLITKRSKFAADFQNEPTKFLRFINGLFSDHAVAEWFLDYLGYCMTGDVGFQKFLLWVGEGGTGKSTVQRIMRLLFGAHCCDVDADSLVQAKQRSAAVDSDLAGARGCRVIFVSEVSPRHRLDERVIKALTGGDTIKVKFMGKDKFDLRADGKLIMTCNERPMLSDDSGIARRLIELRFEKLPEVVIEDLADKLVEEEGPQILGLLAKRAAKHCRDPKAITRLPATLEKWTKECLEDIEYVKAWVDAKTTFLTGAFETTKRLSESWETFCRENHIPAELTPGFLTRRLRKFGYYPDRNEMGQRGWRNVMLRP